MKYLIVLIAVFAGSTAKADLADVSKCAALPSDTERLGCYDKASGRTPEVTLNAPTESDWTVQIETSKLTDDKSVTLFTPSTAPVQCKLKREPSILVARCMEKKTAIYIQTGCFVASSQYNTYGRVEYRVDERKAKSVDMEASTDNGALGLWNKKRALPMIKDMLNGQKLTVRFTPYNDSPIITEFKIAGFAKAYEAAKNECDWK